MAQSAGPSSAPALQQPRPSESTDAELESVSAAPSGDWTRQIHRALRGRYRITFVVTLLLSVVGFSLGWEWSGLLYRSEGMIRIASALPPVLKQTDQNQPIPMFDSFIQAQQELMTSRAVLEAATLDPLWSAKRLGGQKLAVEELAAGLKVDARNRSENIRISFTDPQPEVAVAAVRSTINAYQSAYLRDYAEREQRRLKLLEDYRATLKAQLDAASIDPNSPQPIQPAVGPQRVPTTRPTLRAPQKPLATVLAQTDADLKRLLSEHERLADEIDRDRINYGLAHPSMQRLEKDLELSARRIDRYVDDYYALQLARYQEQVRALEAQEAGEETPVVLAPPPPPPASPVITQLRAQIDDVNQRIDILKTEAAMPKRFEVVKTGEFPVVVPDRRIKTAAVGAAGSAGLALGAMVLAGLLRRQYNFCADVVDDLASWTPYVAAIPELSSSDLRYEADAVQCIHHLRQALDAHSRAYMVSSASGGCGQSSVTMSLALSFAAAGTRTLLIDADTGARGMTTALKMENEVGLADVLSGCEPEFCIKTNRHGLNILPAGLQIDQAGLAFTQAQIAHLLERLRQKFDVILIDAAPMLSSAEPGVIARNVDGVLLTMAKGQNRRMIARALRETQHARAIIIGAVFNRVSTADFDQSIPQRPHLANVGASNYAVPPELLAMGPLVKAMAIAVRAPLDLRRFVDTKMISDSRFDVAQQAAESIAA